MQPQDTIHFISNLFSKTWTNGKSLFKPNRYYLLPFLFETTKPTLLLLAPLRDLRWNFSHCRISFHNASLAKVAVA